VIESSAQRVINFIERTCRLTKDRFAGRPFLLTDWQKKRIIQPIFGPQRVDGTRQVRNAYLEMGSKNGKTELCAAIGLYGLCFDNTRGAEVYICGKARSQAEKMFEVASEMVRLSPHLRKKLRILESTKTIAHRFDRMAFLRAISSDAGVQDGANPSMVLFDELHRQRKRHLYDVMKRKMSTRRNPLFLALSTAGVESESPLCWETHEYARRVQSGIFKDESFCPILFNMPAGADWKDEKNWLLVNPAMSGPGAFKNITAVREDFLKALRIPAQENGFRRFELNEWLSDSERWIPLAEWDAVPMSEPFNPYDLEGMEAFGGLDLSTNRDITAFVLIIPHDEKLFIIPRFFLPGDNLKDRVEKDNVPYDRWVDQGLIHLTPGKSIDMRYVRKVINGLGDLYRIKEIAFDPWGAVQIAGDLERDGFEMVKFRQSVKSYTVPCKAFERHVLQRKLRHGGNPVLRWMVDCTAVKRSSFDEISPVKPDRQTSSSRIDGVVGSLMSLDRIERKEDVDLDGFLANPLTAG